MQQNEDKNFNKLIVKMLLLIVGAVILCRYSSGAFAIILFAIGMCSALARKMGTFFVIYLLIPFLALMNPLIIPKGGIFGITIRVSMFSMSLALILVSASMKTRERIPLGSLFLYLFFLSISSIGGYCPPVSFMKLLLFSIFIWSLYIGSSAISTNPNEIHVVRALMLAFAVFLIYGSLLTLPFPSVCYLSAQMLINAGKSVEEAVATVVEGGSIGLFCGVTSHSQYLGTVLPCIIGWVLCDMLFIQKRIRFLHASLFVLSIPILYLTRSRAALLSFTFMMAVVYLFCLKKVSISHSARHYAKTAMISIVALTVVVAIISELRSHTLSRWIRKNDDTSDSRTVMEALTSSRQGSIEMNLYDFSKNPLLGTGFQVSEQVAELYNSGKDSLIISAPIEKGLLPMLILGEGGVVGAISFVIFILLFYSSCRRQKLYVTSTLFAVFLMTNMAEGNFFSATGGAAGWLISTIGGFSIDIANKRGVMEIPQIDPYIV